MPVYAHYNFDDLDTVLNDSAPALGAQQGIYMSGATASGSRLILDGKDDYAKIYNDPAFQMDRGTVELRFSQTSHVGTGPNTILSRDSEGVNEGSFRVEVWADGRISATHEAQGGMALFETEPGFLSPGDVIEFSYSWDQGGDTPAGISIRNATSGESYEAPVPAGLTMDMGGLNQNWMVGAGQASNPANSLLKVDQFFHGTADFLTFSDSVDVVVPGGPTAKPDLAVTDEDTAVIIDVLANDSAPEGAALRVTLNDDGTLTYQPNPDYNGQDTISYQVSDGQGGTASASVAVTVRPVNDDPVAVDDLAATPLNTPVTVAVLANDSDVDGDPLRILGQPTSSDGTVVVNPDGTITFTPTAGFTGVAAVDYTITDGQGGTASAQVFIGVGARDGIVWGTNGDDVIDTAYLGDNDGDRVDAGDALLPGAAPNDDYIVAGAGNDTVHAGLGDDLVYGGAGADVIYGGAGEDTLHGGAGHDALHGGEGNDAVYGGQGNDTLQGGAGADRLYGGDDRDHFLGAGVGDVIDGGEGGDDFDTLDLTGSGRLRVTFDADNIENGTIRFFDANGLETGTARFENIEKVIPCFTPGTLIATPRGEIPVEELQVGDRIITRDSGVQQIRWIGARPMSLADFEAAPHLRPVMIRAGSLGHGLPERDMMVSPNHRVLVANDRTSLYFDEHEVLVAAKHLIGTKGVNPVMRAATSYIHFMCDRHEVVLSNGAWTETFQPGDQTLGGMGEAQRDEIYEIFPALREARGIESYRAARRTLKRHEAALLLR